MKLQNRIDLLIQLKKYLKTNDVDWQNTKGKASGLNAWFIPQFIATAVDNICDMYLDEEALNKWVNHYHIDDNIFAKNIGLVMAGNIPLVGFHDFLCAFICGHKQTIKLSGKDEVLLKFIVTKLISWNKEVADYIIFADMLKGCDAYIATGSNNSARYFEEYFAKYPNIIRRNRTSVAILTGNETPNELDKLTDDIHLYFGLGCRNVTKIFVPKNYNFEPLLKHFDKYLFFADHHKYKNNYDYQLSIALMNNIYYMTKGSTLLIENKDLFSAISKLNYGFYSNAENLHTDLKNDQNVQCIVGSFDVPFGKAQLPNLFEYADGVDSIQFLLNL